MRKENKRRLERNANLSKNWRKSARRTNKTNEEVIGDWRHAHNKKETKDMDRTQLHVEKLRGDSLLRTVSEGKRRGGGHDKDQSR